MSKTNPLTIWQALTLVVYLDDTLKRKDFDRRETTMLGLDFSGYYDRMSCRVTSGCSKITCITLIVGYLNGESLGPSSDTVVEWLDKKAPGWREKINFKEDADGK